MTSMAALTAGMNRPGATADLGPGGPPAVRTTGPAGADRSARWDPRTGSHLAVITYGAARALPDPRAAVLEFCNSAYQAGARLAGWDTTRFASPGGRTDPRA